MKIYKLIYNSQVLFEMKTIDKIHRYVNGCVKKAYFRIYLPIQSITKLIFNPLSMRGLTYYPERMQHSYLRIWFDQLVNTLKYGSPNSFYYLYGLDVKTRTEARAYVHYNEFWYRRDYLNWQPQSHNAKIVLRDKMYFGIVAASLGINTPKNIAIIRNGIVFSLKDSKEISLIDLLKDLNETCFCKQIDGECGNNIYKIRYSKGVLIVNDKETTEEEFICVLSDAEYLLQKLVIQHSEMCRLYPYAVNTMRLVTIRNSETNEIELFPSMLRVGANGSVVDNTSKGGFAIGFNLETGKLIPPGFHKPQYGLKVYQHPDTGVNLESFVIPYVKEAIYQAKRFHSFLGLHSIGWDIAIGQDGPIIIEGNDNWEINGPQSVNGGLKTLFDKYFK